MKDFICGVTVWILCGLLQALLVFAPLILALVNPMWMMALFITLPLYVLSTLAQ